MKNCIYISIIITITVILAQSKPSSTPIFIYIITVPIIINMLVVKVIDHGHDNDAPPTATYCHNFYYLLSSPHTYTSTTTVATVRTTTMCCDGIVGADSLPACLLYLCMRHCTTPSIWAATGTRPPKLLVSNFSIHLAASRPSLFPGPRFAPARQLLRMHLGTAETPLPSLGSRWQRRQQRCGAATSKSSPSSGRWLITRDQLPTGGTCLEKDPAWLRK